MPSKPKTRLRTFAKILTDVTPRECVYTLGVSVFCGILNVSVASAKPLAGISAATATATSVAVIRRAGLPPYEAIIDRFRAAVRAPIQSILLDRPDTNNDSPPNARVYFAIGQSAYGWATAHKLVPLVYTLVFDSEMSAGTNVGALVRPEYVLDAAQTLVPQLRSILVLFGPYTGRFKHAIHKAAAKRQLTVVDGDAADAHEVIPILQKRSHDVQAILLLPDLKLLTANVLRYAVALQFRKKIPVIGVSRQHVRLGTLCALDYAPSVLGRRAATIINRMLTGRWRVRARGRADVSAAYGSDDYRISVNAETAEILGIPVPPRSSAIDVLR